MTKTTDKTKATDVSEKAVVEIDGFKFDTGLTVPVVVTGTRSSETARKLAAMPVGASFLEAVTVPDTIKTDAERVAAFREQARSASNRLSGAVRRFKRGAEKVNDTANAAKAFVVRTVDSDELGRGVRVYRTA